MTEHRDPADQIDQEGAYWAARMDRGLSKQEQAVLDDWLEGDMRRLGALSRARAAWIHAERAGALGGMPTAHPNAMLNRRKALFGGGALAASIAAGAVGYWMLSPTTNVVANGIGEVRRLTLADGTVVTLDAVSRLSFDFNEVSRVVTLFAGQAFFEVAREPARSFLVRAATTVIHVVNSDFLVRLQSDASTQVLVRTGVVALAASDRAAAKPHRLEAGWEATLPNGPAASAPQLVRLAPQSFDRLLAWREGQLAFVGDTLAQAIVQFEHYNSTRIVVPDASLAAEPITGSFASNDPEGFAHAAAASLGARVVMRGSEIIIERI